MKNKQAITKMTQEAITKMTQGWAAYAVAHKAHYNSLICDDYVLGPAWLEVGQSLLTLLNGETGSIDCGAWNRAILETIVENGGEEE